ncbi:forkhead box protein C1 isoform X2 [Denticeps clupeoides]|uniref:forkhead box protein C1 isoform X2 n=1 Tax=Denticeps clupeoides TaxID=299321 RepID=UPI0010A41F06|nr:forkhead box protein C1-like isoform X2 [Denticeps clupeoides]
MSGRPVTDIPSPEPLKGPWWDQPDLPQAEKLWALTLKAFIPSLKQEEWEAVPDLPEASLLKSDDGKREEWRWCCPGDEVSALPESPAEFQRETRKASQPGQQVPPPHASPMSGEAGSSNSHPKPAVPSQVRGGASSDPGATLASDSSGVHARVPVPASESWHQKEENRTGQRMKIPSSSHRRKDAVHPNAEPDRPGTSAGARRKRETEQECQTKITAAMGVVSLERTGSVRSAGVAQRDGIKRRASPALQRGGGGVSDSSAAGPPAPPLISASAPKRGGDGGEGAGSQSARGGGAPGRIGGLDCCPMCLMPFPAGFSQMDCDGHLAQCLSDMNTDMVW